MLILHANNYTFPATTLPSRRPFASGCSNDLRHDSKSRANFSISQDTRMKPTLRAWPVSCTRNTPASHFDAVVMLGITGMPFLLEHREMFAPGVPVVFSDVTRATYEAMHLPPDVTAVINEYYPEKTLELAESLQPDARRLVVIAGNDSLDRRWRERYARPSRPAIRSLRPPIGLTSHTTRCWQTYPGCRATPSSCSSPSLPTAKTNA